MTTTTLTSPTVPLRGTVRAVPGVDLGIAAGEVGALPGPNGAGRSSTIDLPGGVETVEVHEDRIALRCSDSGTAPRGLLRTHLMTPPSAYLIAKGAVARLVAISVRPARAVGPGLPVARRYRVDSVRA